MVVYDPTLGKHGLIVALGDNYVDVTLPGGNRDRVPHRWILLVYDPKENREQR
jgi:hypothetical protein